MSEASRDAALIRWIRKNQPFRVNYKWLDNLAKTRESGEWVPDLELDPMYHERRECIQCLQADNEKQAAELSAAKAELELERTARQQTEQLLHKQAETIAAEQAKNVGLLEAFQAFIDSHEECTDFDDFTAQIVSMDDYHKAVEALESA